MGPKAVQNVSWFALSVHPQTESVVSRKLAGAGIDAFYPHVHTRSKDKRRDLETKFMPGYVFASFELADKTPVIAIVQVVGILGFGDHAVSIPEVEIAAVKLIVSFPKLAQPCAYVATGDRVRVRSGPLRGLEGYVCYLKSITRIIVSVPMLARSISAEVDAQSLEVLERADLAA